MQVKGYLLPKQSPVLVGDVLKLDGSFYLVIATAASKVCAKPFSGNGTFNGYHDGIAEMVHKLGVRGTKTEHFPAAQYEINIQPRNYNY